MKYQTKYEIMVYNLLPAIRKYLAKCLSKKMTQKETARIMGLTEGAISQYLTKKRGKATLTKSQKNYVDGELPNIISNEKTDYESLMEMCWKVRK